MHEKLTFTHSMSPKEADARQEAARSTNGVDFKVLEEPTDQVKPKALLRAEKQGRVVGQTVVSSTEGLNNYAEKVAANYTYFDGRPKNR